MNGLLEGIPGDIAISALFVALLVQASWSELNERVYKNYDLKPIPAFDFEIIGDKTPDFEKPAYVVRKPSRVAQKTETSLTETISWLESKLQDELWNYFPFMWGLTESGLYRHERYKPLKKGGKFFKGTVYSAVRQTFIVREHVPEGERIERNYHWTVSFDLQDLDPSTVTVGEATVRDGSQTTFSVYVSCSKKSCMKIGKVRPKPRALEGTLHEKPSLANQDITNLVYSSLSREYAERVKNAWEHAIRAAGGAESKELF